MAGGPSVNSVGHRPRLKDSFHGRSQGDVSAVRNVCTRNYTQHTMAAILPPPRGA